MRDVLRSADAFDRNRVRELFLALAPFGNNLVEHVSFDGARRDAIRRDAIGSKFERPSPKHADHARLGRGVIGSRFEPQSAARGNADNAAELRRLHRRQRGLHDRYHRCKMKFGEIIEIIERRFFDPGRTDGAGVVNEAQNAFAGGYCGNGVLRLFSACKIRLHECERLMHLFRRAAGD